MKPRSQDILLQKRIIQADKLYLLDLLTKREWQIVVARIKRMDLEGTLR